MKKNIIFLNRVLAAVPGGSGGNGNQGVDFKSVAGGDGECLKPSNAPNK